MNLSPDNALINRSITRRLTASLIITVLIVSVIAVTAMHRVVSQAALRSMENKADGMIAYLTGTLEIPLWSVEEDTVKAIGKAVSHDESIARLIIRNESGTVVFSMNKGNGGDLIHRSGKISHKQGNRESSVGDVSVSLTPALYNESNRRLLFFSMLIIVFILIAVAIVTILFIRTALNKPLTTLGEIANRFASGIYDTTGHTLPYLEFQPFGRALAEMASKIEGQIRMLRKGEEDVRRINERLSLATHAAQLGVWDWDIPKNELLWDDSMYRLYGLQMGDFGGAYDAWARTIHPQDKAQTEGEIQAALRGEREYGPEFRIVRPDGTIRYIKADSQTFRDEAGKPMRMIGTNIDITERKQAEEKIRMLNQELEQRVAERTAQLEAANKELEAFCYSVSHDLRAPLRHIDGYVDLLVSRCREGLSDKGVHYVDTIAASARQMGFLIDDLLLFSRTGRAEMRREPMEMNQALQDVLPSLQESCAGRAIEWVIEELPMVRGDFALLRQVWANLLGNAAKYTRTRETARIEVSCHSGDGEIIFVVADNGVGFDMQYAGKLFGVFQRLHSQEEFEGTGIGLATVQRIITRHGGRVWAEAEPDRGAKFYFTLPN